jgi:hypothetical protein
MISRGGVAVALAFLSATGVAQEPDLDQIPQAPPSNSAAAATGGTTGTLYIADAVTVEGNRTDLLVPTPLPYDWQERLLVDLTKTWNLGPQLRLVASDRLNLRAESDLSFPDDHNLVNDLREAYIAWRTSDELFLDVGRINFKSGLALGYNPTDFFKTRTVSEPLSADPTVLREDRLGTLMVRAQQLWQHGSVTAAFAPRIEEPSAIYSNASLPSIDPMFDRTNSQSRFLLKSTFDLAENVNPELLYYHAGDRSTIGTNLAATVGKGTVVYLEWSGAERPSLILDAEAYGRTTGTLPAAGPAILRGSTASTFKNELALGASYTTTKNLTINLEYHLNQAGFTAFDWNQWFRTGVASAPEAPVTQTLWYLRSYAQDQQQQNTEQATFIRADWVDAFGLKLELTGFSLIDLHDRSSQCQLSASYYLSPAWTASAQVSANAGSRRSDFGSLPTAYSMLLELRRYF